MDSATEAVGRKIKPEQSTSPGFTKLPLNSMLAFTENKKGVIQG